MRFIVKRIPFFEEIICENEIILLVYGWMIRNTHISTSYAKHLGYLLVGSCVKFLPVFSFARARRLNTYTYCVNCLP